MEGFQRIRAKWLSLAVVNIHQPVRKAYLVEKLKSSIDVADIDSILKELVKEKRLAKEQGRYRLTYHGTKSILPATGRVMRDIHRMKYLVNISKGRGER